MIDQFKNHLIANDYSGTYYYNIKPFFKFCTEQGIDYFKITYNDINKYVISCKDKGHGKGFINNLLKAMRCFYKFLVLTHQADQGILDIARSFKLLQEDHKIHDFLTKKELDKLISEGMTYGVKRMSPIKLKALLYFLFYTGLRKGELLNLKRIDIDLKKHQAIVRTPTKNKRERIVIYTRKVSALMRTYFKLEAEENNAFNMTTNKIQDLIQDLSQYMPAGKRLTVHTFRHSFANLLASNEISIRVAQKLLGHQNLNSTMIYYDPDITMVQDLYNKRLETKKGGQ